MERGRISKKRAVKAFKGYAILNVSTFKNNDDNRIFWGKVLAAVTKMDRKPAVRRAHSFAADARRMSRRRKRGQKK